MISKSRPQPWTHWSRKPGASRGVTALASWGPGSAGAFSLWSSVLTPGLLPPRSAVPSSFAPPPTARTWQSVERLPLLSAAAAFGGHSRAELVGGGVDVSRRGRGGAPDHRSRIRLEADRSAAPAVRSSGTPIHLVSHGIPAPRSCRARRAADRRSISGHQRVAQRQASRVALRVLRSVRLCHHALPE